MEEADRLPEEKFTSLYQNHRSGTRPVDVKMAGADRNLFFFFPIKASIGGLMILFI